ncbi:MAG TPA: TIGR03960 family B12-binding radical SAM protein [Clostridiales bacterium]|nr:TIGR03960 family B12-binding radical SAM protein [Clostridiales bacterium]
MRVEKPARYTGGEYNTPDMDKEHKLSFCLCFADVYEVAMSNLGIAILYDILNKDKDIVCQRCFAPWPDMGELLKEHNIPLMSIEKRKPLKDFDMIGFSLQYEMAYTNMLYMLDLAHIPFRAKDRSDDYPILIAGGPCTANPEPFADFFDIVYIGEGEEVNSKLCKLYLECGKDKRSFLREAAKIDGVYVPLLAETKNGITVTKVKKAVIKDLNKAPYPTKPLIPNLEIVHDRAVLELFRGCYAGCRFCQACFFYRPIRYRDKETLVDYAKKLLHNTGHEEIGLSSLSTGDYEDIYGVIADIKCLADSKNVNLQMPSLRLDSFSAKLMKGARKSSLTFAPEAGTQRLRNVINKNITDEDINKSMEIAFETGYSNIKLYFMLGLPTETDEDILGIAEIANRINEIYYRKRRNRALSINLSTAMFVPKPLTPFQWVEQISIDEMLRKQILLRNELKRIKGVKYNWHTAEVSKLEGVFARGGRELSYVIENAYNNGCRFDGWDEHFNYDLWLKAFESTGLDMESYSRQRDLEERLPWDFIDFGVKKSYLIKEYKKAMQGLTTPSCKNECQMCGVSSLGKCRRHKGEGNA